MGRFTNRGTWNGDARRRKARKSLDSIQIAKPCSARWEEMEGDEKARFCAHCNLNVYNLSAMDVEEAARVIAEKDGRLCVRFYRRRDGTTLTQECPVGAAAWRKRLVVAWSAAAGACSTMLFGLAAWNPFVGRVSMGAPAPLARIPKDDTVTAIVGGIGPASPGELSAEQGQPLMGDLVMPRQGRVVSTRARAQHGAPTVGEARSDP